MREPTRDLATTSAVDAAWKIHGQLADWTGKADDKASFVLTLNSLFLAGVLALRLPNAFLADLHSQVSGITYVIARVLLAVAIVLAGLSVAPVLRLRNDLKNASVDNYIYFGHLRHWDPQKLGAALGGDILPSLSRQLVVMSEVAWRKHMLILWSMGCAGAGLVSTAFAVLAN